MDVKHTLHGKKVWAFWTTNMFICFALTPHKTVLKLKWQKLFKWRKISLGKSFIWFSLYDFCDAIFFETVTSIYVKTSEILYLILFTHRNKLVYYPFLTNIDIVFKCNIELVQTVKKLWSESNYLCNWCMSRYYCMLNNRNFFFRKILNRKRNVHFYWVDTYMCMNNLCKFTLKSIASHMKTIVSVYMTLKANSLGQVCLTFQRKNKLKCTFRSCWNKNPTLTTCQTNKLWLDNDISWYCYLVECWRYWTFPVSN